MLKRVSNIALGLSLLLTPLMGWGQPQGWHYNAGGRLLGVKSRGNNIWVVGQGVILHSTDRGNTWNFRESGTSVDLYGVSFPDDLNGWAVGDNDFDTTVILRTRDGGLTWQKQYHLDQRWFRGVCFADTLHGFVCGPIDTILKTTDGGATWSKISFNQLSHATGISFIDTLRGWASSESGGSVLKTTDGGQTWIAKPAPDWLYGLDMLDSLTGWAAGGSIFKTTDGWETSTVQYTGPSLNGISIGDSLSVWSVGFNHRIVKTSNGGSTWVTDTSQTQSGNYYGVDGHLQLTNVTVVGNGGAIIRSTNAGSTWRVIRNVDIANRSLYNVSFYDSNQGWAVGSYGVITHTTNGGTVWQRQTSNVNSFLFGVSFADSQYGKICTGGGGVLGTRNGGNTWAGESTGATSSLYSIEYPDTAFAVAVGGYYGPLDSIKRQGDKGTRGQGETALQSANWRANDEIASSFRPNTPWDGTSRNDTLPIGGADPTPNPSPKAFPGSASGTGGEGRYDFWKWSWKPEETIQQISIRTITRTTNGGSLWIAQNSAGQSPLYGVSFVTTSEGWACGDPQGVMGVILHTTDSGATWQGQNSNVNQGLRWIQFKDRLTGWCVGTNGTALWTTDGGNTWNPGNSGTPNHLWSCAFYDNLNGFACGNNGLLIMTTDGGRNWTPDTSNKAHANLTALRALDTLHTWAVGGYGIVLGWREAGTSGVEHGSTGAGELRVKNGIKAWPNPFVSYARVPGREKERFALYDITGRRVGTYKGDKIGADATAGVYFLMAEGKEAGPRSEGRPVRIVKVR